MINDNENSELFYEKKKFVEGIQYFYKYGMEAMTSSSNFSSSFVMSGKKAS